MPAKKEEEAVAEKSRGATKRHEYTGKVLAETRNRRRRRRTKRRRWKEGRERGACTSDSR